MKILQIEASGNAYEIGYSHGKNAKEYVKHSIQTYKRLFLQKSGIVWKEALEMASEFIDPIQQFDSDILDEMHGIADGAGVEFEEILALNTRSELCFKGKETVNESLLDGCTAIAATSEFTKNNNILIGQNWDWDKEQQYSLVLIRIKQHGKPTILMVTEAGVIAKTGMNSAGLGLCFNALSIDKYESGVPVHCVLRKILKSKTLDEAMRIVTQTTFACSGNIMIAHKEGEAADLEKDWKNFHIFYPDDGYLVHTNHFAHIKMPTFPFIDTLRINAPHSVMRYGRAQKLIKRYAGVADLHSFQNILSDHVNQPTAICRHENKGEAITVFSIIMDLTNGVLWICVGQPCCNPYVEYKIDCDLQKGV